MKIVFLAFVTALAAGAAPLFPTDNFACMFGNGGPVSACVTPSGVQQLEDPGNGVQGIKFYTLGTFTFSDSATSASIYMQTSQVMNESFIATIPLAYEFTLTGNVSTWTLGFSLSQTSGNSYFVQVGGSGAGTFSGVANFTGPVDFDAGLSTNANFLLNINYTGAGASATIPSNSIDFNAAVPEPSSFALMGLGLALAGWKVRRNRTART